MAVADLRKRMGLVMGLRALLMLLAGLYAVIWPAQALFILVWAGAILLIVDGALGLWALTFGGQKTGNYWFDVIRNVLAIITGVLILVSPILGALITVRFVVYLLAFQALLFAPLFGAVVLTIMGGVLMILFSIALGTLAWRMWKGGEAKAAA